jgi:hypothetical protein
MKWILAIGLCLAVAGANAQTPFLKDAVLKLDQALVEKDTFTLKQLLHKDLSYGHSNAWIENRGDLISNLFNGKLSYKKIDSKEHQWMSGKEWASVRTNAEIVFVLDGKEGVLKLHILQFWLRTNRGWQLVARQSTKVG